MSPARPDALDRFVRALEAGWRETGGEESALLPRVEALMRELVASDDWLDPARARPHPQYYQQHLLHLDPEERFSVVSFVWGPGQATPIHNHTVWGLIGVLRGAEVSERFEPRSGGLDSLGPPHRLDAGVVEAVSPSVGDIHRVANAHDDRISISIHLYGANIGAVRRHIFDDLGRPRTFVSGYANAVPPNLWRTSETLP